MSTSSEQRRRTEAALVRAIDMDASIEAPATHSAVCAYVDLLTDGGHLPEAVVIAFKATIGRAESLQRLQTDVREVLRSALVSACIQRYFTRRVLDDARITPSPSLQLVRDEPEVILRAQAPDAQA